MDLTWKCIAGGNKLQALPHLLKIDIRHWKSLRLKGYDELNPSAKLAALHIQSRQFKSERLAALYCFILLLARLLSFSLPVFLRGLSSLSTRKEREGAQWFCFA